MWRYLGTSVHQLDLALDIVDVANQVLDERQENTKVQKWPMKNSWKYGLILRYPNR
ncbi:D-alanyl-D-alanine carboxypeptidase family protein [Acutalibacter intestini]|uniref:D-alanyl-D-alanine carboxypeptidase family protein n=1 Tax=Acutalibacter intestini TaxID=3093659 RepID=UPI0034613844